MKDKGKQMENINNFDALIKRAIALPMQKIAVVCGDDPNAIEAIERSVKNNIANAVMVGDEKATKKLADKLGVDQTLFEYVDEPDRTIAAKKAVDLIKAGEAQIIMKGSVGTDIYARAILDKENGLMPKNAVMTHITALESEHYSKLLFLSDVAILPEPTIKQKILMINYCVEAAQHFGIDLPKVAVLSFVEKVNPKIQSTVDAAVLSKMSQRHQIKNCIVDGPLAMDIAISPECLHGKKVDSPVQAQADILILPNLETGNILYKGLIHLGKAKVAGILAGPSCPGVLVSRTDSEDVKFYSIAFAVYLSAKRLEKNK